MDHEVYARNAARDDEIRRVIHQTIRPSESVDADTELEARVETLERHVDYLVDILNALLDHMYGPDDRHKPKSVLTAVNTIYQEEK